MKKDVFLKFRVSDDEKQRFIRATEQGETTISDVCRDALVRLEKRMKKGGADTTATAQKQPVGGA